MQAGLLLLGETLSDDWDEAPRDTPPDKSSPA